MNRDEIDLKSWSFVEKACEIFEDIRRDEMRLLEVETEAQIINWLNRLYKFQEEL